MLSERADREPAEFASRIQSNLEGLDPSLGRSDGVVVKGKRIPLGEELVLRVGRTHPAKTRARNPILRREMERFIVLVLGFLVNLRCDLNRNRDE